MLLPPKQFRDAPSPASSLCQSNGEEAGAVDNILYHIYESPRKNLACQLINKKQPLENIQGAHE